jgi:nitrite reductase/ring-hydroxylating ferredoxin subunit
MRRFIYSQGCFRCHDGERVSNDRRRTRPQNNGGGDRFSQITRRTFCNDLLLTSTVVMLGAPAVAGETAIVRESEIAYPARKIEGAEQLIVGSSLYFEYPTRNDPAVLLRSAEGEYVAYSRKCSHAGCSVEFDSQRRCLKCPCHQGAFDARMGLVVFGPPRRPLDQIVLQMRAGGQVWAIGKSVGRDAERIAKL